MKLIELKDPNNNQAVYINADAIAYIEEPFWVEGKQSGWCKVYMSDGQYKGVVGTPAEVVKQIKDQL